MASIDQSGDFNRSIVDQNFGSNTADVLQTGLGTALDPNTVSIAQFGGSNSAYAEQNGGEGNSIIIEQGSGGSPNSALAFQDGSFNTTVIDQQP